MAKLIAERISIPPGAKVDRSGPQPIIRGVPLCGPTSANRRRYRREAFAGDRVRRYEGVWVYLNHGDGRTARRVEDRIARVTRPRLNAAGYPIGDLVVRPRHPYAEQFLWDAEHDPGSCGMSHVARCETVRGVDGWEEITEIVSVESVDLVADPATTSGLSESRGRCVAESKRPIPKTLARLREQFGEPTAAKSIVPCSLKRLRKVCGESATKSGGPRTLAELHELVGK